MAHSNLNPSPGDPPPSTSPEAELDALLTQVTGITDDIAVQVGAPARVIQLGKRKAEPKPDTDTKDAQASDSAQEATLLEDLAAANAEIDALAKTAANASRAPADTAPLARAELGSAVLGAIFDALDRPFRWCGPRIRSAAGWAALAVLFAAAIVFALSFLE